MHVFTIPADKWDETNPDKQAIRHLIMKHRRSYERLKGLKNYYEGRHKILDEDREKQAGMQSCKRYRRYSQQLFHRQSGQLQKPG